MRGRGKHGAESKLERFDFQKMKSGAMHHDDATRKKAFVEYFERFGEFPSYLFDQQSGVDPMLMKTIEDIRGDAESSKAMLAGIDALMMRLE